MLNDLLPMAYTACLLIEPRTTSSGMELPAICWILLPHILIKKMSYSFVCSLFLWRHFLIEVPSSLMTLA